MPIKHEGSRLVEVYSLSDFQQALHEINGMATPAQVAKKLGCNARVAREKMKGYVTEGKIKGQKIADRWVFWI